ncbi:thiamine phosphate synthase [Thalassospira mesophila]|uniref:thiamine phosphate synthase n=1 Tax=Thalassospira mesophila TaxID=1293891 RepID=UPI000A200E8B|nr:thiamine phosphate synthase [Thalassospira mesophila]
MEPKLAKLARQLNLRNAPASALPAIIVMTDDQRLPDPRPALARLPTHSMVIFRHYNHPERARMANSIRRACRKYGHLFFVASDVALAVRVKADGIHVPDHGQKHLSRLLDLACTHNFAISASLHGLAQFNRLRPFIHRLDAVIISPVFPTKSHPGAKTMPAPTFHRLAALAAQSGCAAYALGGIRFDRLYQIKSAPVCGIAGISFAT